MTPDFFRVMPWAPEDSLDPRRILVPPRRLQGGARHDNADLYTALYGSTSPESCISEALQNFGPNPTEASLTRNGKRLHLIKFGSTRDLDLLDADDPLVLKRLAARPSTFATRKRELTQPIAKRIYGEGKDGLLWWSTIEASWINVTLFFERIASDLSLRGKPVKIEPDSERVKGLLTRH